MSDGVNSYLHHCKPYWNYWTGSDEDVFEGEIEKTGAWTLGSCAGAYYIDLRLAAAIGQHLLQTGAQTILELGAGCGCYTRFLTDHFGLSVSAFDGASDMYSLSSGRVRVADLTKWNEFGMHDWVICLEVGEHIPRKFEPILLRHMVNNTRKGLLMSWAYPGQGGEGHVNEQPHSEVIRKVTKLGLVFNHEATAWFRSVAGLGCCGWFKDTLMVFERP